MKELENEIPDDTFPESVDCRKSGDPVGQEI